MPCNQVSIMEKVLLVLACCALLAGVAGEKSSPSRRITDNRFDGSKIDFSGKRNVEKRDDSDYSYSSEVLNWNSHESEVDVKRRQAESPDTSQKKMVRRELPFRTFPNIARGDDFIYSFDDNKIEVNPVPEAFNAKLKFLQLLFPSSFISLADKRLLDFLQFISLASKGRMGLNGKQSTHRERRAIDLFKGVKSLTDTVKNVNPLEGALNSEALLHGVSKNKTTDRSVIKANAKNFLSPSTEIVRIGPPDSSECIKCKPNLQKRSADENDDSLDDVPDVKDTTDETTTSSPTLTSHHHHRKGSRKHPKKKGGRGTTTIEPNETTFSLPKETHTAGERKVTSKKAHELVSTFISTRARPHKKVSHPDSDTKKAHTLATMAFKNAKKEAKSTSPKTEQEVSTQNPPDDVTEDAKIMVDDTEQKSKDVRAPSIIDGKPKFLKSNDRSKSLLPEALKGKLPADEEDAQALGNMPKSLIQSQSEKEDKARAGIAVGTMKMNLTAVDKGDVKSPLLMDTKVLISGAVDPKEAFSIGKMKGLLLLGESEDFVHGDQKDLSANRKVKTLNEQDDTDDQLAADDVEDQQDTSTTKKLPVGKPKNFVPGGKPKSLLDALRANIPFPELKASEKPKNDKHKDHLSEVNAEKRHTKRPKTKLTTETSRLPPITNEETQSSADKENVTPSDSELNLSTSGKETPAAPEPNEDSSSFPISDAGKDALLSFKQKSGLLPVNKPKNLFPTGDNEAPSLPEGPKSLTFDQNSKIFDDVESFYKEVESMASNDTSQSGKSDINGYSAQDAEKQPNDSFQQTQDNIPEEKNPDNADTKQEEIDAFAVVQTASKTNLDVDIPIAAAKPKIDGLIPKSLLENEQADQNKKEEEYGLQGGPKQTNETNEPSLTDERQIYEETDIESVGKAIPAETGDSPGTFPEDENEDQPNADQLTNDDLPAGEVSPDLDSKGLAASLNAKGFMPRGNPNAGRLRYPDRNRYLVPEEKSAPKDESPMSGVPSIDRGFIPNNGGSPGDRSRGLANRFPDTVSQQRDGQRGQEAPRGSSGQQPNGNQGQSGNIERPRGLVPPGAQPNDMAQGIRSQPGNSFGEEQGQLPMGNSNFSPDMEYHSDIEIGPVPDSKHFQEQFHPPQYPFPGYYPQQYGRLNDFNPNPYPGLYEANKAFHDNVGSLNPGIYSGPDDLRRKNFMPGFGQGGGYNYN